MTMTRARSSSGRVRRSSRASSGSRRISSTSRAWTEGSRRLSQRATRPPISWGAPLPLSVRMPAASVEVVCDRNRIEMALANLVGNAVKFVQDGGTVGVETAAEAGLLRFVVTDNGPGIAPEDLPHVFERFFRGRNARSEGAGLGLAIAQSIARAHGGSLRVQSEPGAGCVFTLEIPLDASTA